MKRYSLANLPMGKWDTYEKRRYTLAIKMSGSFELSTFNGSLVRDGGYLVLDGYNQPYHMSTKEFNAKYSIVR